MRGDGRISQLINKEGKLKSIGWHISVSLEGDWPFTTDA
jgi:hypothetical protein